MIEPRTFSRHQSTPLARVVARPFGAVVTGLAAAMAVCAAVGLGYELAGAARPGVDDGAVLRMLVACATTGLLGALSWRYGAGVPSEGLRRREAAAVVTAIWFGVGVVGALPFVIGAGLGPLDAVFEATSGFTTTGSTVVTDIEGTLSRPVLLWRSMIQWLGGMGIVVLFVAVFPSLGVGAKHLYRSEVPGHSAEGLQPRITETAVALWRIYLGLTVVLAVILGLLGMDPFEAACHALTALPTGGFSTRDASIGAFGDPWIETTIAVFMLLASVNFALYFNALARRSIRSFFRSTELRVFGLAVALAVVVVSVGILPNHGNDPVQALRYGFFFVSSTISTTGYGTDDYMGYAPPLVGVMLLLMLVGGCSGSTAGGMKVSRIVLLFKTAWREIRRAIRPQVVHVVRLDRPAVADSVLIEVAAFFFVFVTLLGAGTVLVSFTDGLSLQTAFGAMVTTTANNGPAPFYDGSDNFAGYSGVAKTVFIAAMVLGRLELMTVLALFHPDMWR